MRSIGSPVDDSDVVRQQRSSAAEEGRCRRRLPGPGNTGNENSLAFDRDCSGMKSEAAAQPHDERENRPQKIGGHVFGSGPRKVRGDAPAEFFDAKPRAVEKLENVCAVARATALNARARLPFFDQRRRVQDDRVAGLQHLDMRDQELTISLSVSNGYEAVDGNGRSDVETVDPIAEHGYVRRQTAFDPPSLFLLQPISRVSARTDPYRVNRGGVYGFRGVTTAVVCS